QFLGLVEKVLPGWFPHLPEQSQDNRRLRRLAPVLAAVQLRVAELLPSSELRIADGTLLGVANYPGCASRSEFAGTAAYGYCPSKSQFVWGMRLVLVTDPNGLPLGYTLVAASEKEYEPVRELATAHAGCTLIADKGLWGREYREILALQGVTIRTPTRRRDASSPERERRLATLRLVIGSTFSNLKRQMRLEQHLAKTPAGLVQRIAQRLLALTLGMLVNALTGRPPRALVAYDGR
ncbi:MAG: transposase, partial [Thermoleophilia bacterium]|nr:transposase [Thermoleophilia bacterium]